MASSTWRVLSRRCTVCVWFFFFQAEDGIRDYKVTGVQTCALPICALGAAGFGDDALQPAHGVAAGGGGERELERRRPQRRAPRSEEHTSELQSPCNLVCRLLLEKKKKYIQNLRSLQIKGDV